MSDTKKSEDKVLTTITIKSHKIGKFSVPVVSLPPREGIGPVRSAMATLILGKQMAKDKGIYTEKKKATPKGNVQGA